ncbi:type IV pilus assembly PilZ [Thermaerobacter marianensis DSM 12885]|uniref:Type IV pilus assembly PilZ n=1 Tax=Thermaerobacter marianensis (strain ATCC 700841 / DSM 12885 / JCM 10246 / 7p75a) TaxID=644966 RepID=E6SJP9_THEM7|nr:PilZ domain-containing protein [Thermaerobacter marianensis]ADU51112.1 type IV pilus assembly PilZ [Thermaerobacter marianensis DSM 12885]
MGDVESLPLVVNQTVELSFVGDPPAGWAEGPYRTHVLDVGPNGVVLALPMARQRWVVPRPGQAVRVVYRDPRDPQADRGVYSFVTVVVDARVAPEPELVVALPQRVERVQRRHWVRLDLRLPVRLERRTDPPQVLTGRTLDVSGGGARVVVSGTVATGELVRVEVEFPGWRARATARVVRVESGDEPVAGLEFVEIDPRVQDRIAGFILAEQARRRWLLG